MSTDTKTVNLRYHYSICGQVYTNSVCLQSYNDNFCVLATPTQRGHVEIWLRPFKRNRKDRKTSFSLKIKKTEDEKDVLHASLA